MAADALPPPSSTQLEEKIEFFERLENVSEGEAATMPEELLKTPHSRYLGHTEQNWCRAVDGGTGNTVIGLLVKAPLEVPAVQAAVADLQRKHPRTRSRLIHINGRPAFQVAAEPNVRVEVVENWTQPADSDDEAQARDGEGAGAAPSSSAPRMNGAVAEARGEGQHGVGEGLPEEEDVFHDADDGAEGEGWAEGGSGRCEDEEGVTEGPFSMLGRGGSFKLSMCQQRWLRIVEAEMNSPWGPPDAPRREERPPLDLLQVRLFRLLHGRSLLLLKAHTCACDRTSAATITRDFLAALDQRVNGPGQQEEQTSQGAEAGEAVAAAGDGDGSRGAPAPPQALQSVEAAIPRGKAKKPFWAHGVDVVGYGLGSRRHACLPFQQPEEPRRTQLIRSGLNRQDTDALVQRCKEEGVCLTAALSAAALKAAAAAKRVGPNQEHYCITTLMDCRPLLDPPFPDFAVGFYHSAMLNTHHVGETTAFWDLARRCQNSVDSAIKHRKHFTDMGDLNLLMKQAMEHPNLTPASSLRTSLLSIFWNTLQESMQIYSERLHIEDYVGCSSVHGVGPCLGIFDSIREDGLHLANVYAAPLFSRPQMKALISQMMEILKAALAKSA